MHECAICLFFGDAPQPVTGNVGLITNVPTLIDAALDRLGQLPDGHHVVVAACPEHVVDVYRERVPNVRMAWRLGEAPTPLRRSPAAVSASQA